MIQDKKTGEEIVYNVDSSSGYVQDGHYSDENNLQQQTIEDDNHSHHSMMTTTQATSTTTTAVPTTTFDLELFKEKLREKRRKALAMKMRHMFKSLGNKYKKEKEKILKIPKELFSRKPQKAFTTQTTTTIEPTTRKVPEVAEEQDDEEVVFVGDDFDDFVPMEYEVVEDIIIENY